MTRIALEKKEARKREVKAFAEGFAARIRQLRIQRFGENRGSKSAAASAISVSPSDWQGYESGVVPGADKIQKVCEMFDCDPKWLLGMPERGDSGLSQTQENLLESLSDIQEILHSFDNMFTDCLVNLKSILTDPPTAQKHSFKLYAIAQKLAQIKFEIEEEHQT